MVNARAFSIFARTTGLAPLIRKGVAQARRSCASMTLRKALNLVLLEMEKRASRSVLLSRPYHYVIDPVNYCVLHCPLCPTGRGTLKREKGQMALDDYQRLVSEVAPYAVSVDLYNWGEPLIHKQIFDMVHFAKSKGISTKVSTNLNVINESKVTDLVSCGLDELVVSLDGADQRTYEQYRSGGDLAKVVWGVRQLVAEKQKRRSRTPWLTIRILVHKGNEATVPDIKQLAWALGANNVVAAPILVNINRPEDTQKWLPSDPRYSYYDYGAKVDRSLARVKRCPYLWERMVISWDGGVSPCCWFDSPENDFGNVFRDGMSAVWNAPRYVSARGLFGKAGGPSDTICSRCGGRPGYEY